MSSIFAIARKDLLLLTRNRAALFFTFAWPLIVALFFGVVFGAPSKGASAITVLVVNEDAGANAGALVERLRTTEGLKVEIADRASALDSVKRGRRPAAVLIPAGYSEASDRMFYGTPAKLELAVDPARKAEAAMLEGMLMGTAMRGMQDMFTNTPRSQAAIDKALADAATTPDPSDRADLTRFLGELKSFVGRDTAQAPGSAGAVGQAAWQPVEIVTTEVAQQRDGPRSAYDVTFPQGALWGMIGCAFGFAISLVLERTHGTLTRLQMSPVSRTQVLAGKALACFLAIVIVQVLLFGIARIAFGVRPGSLPLLIAAGVSLGIAFVGIMMVISVLGKTEQAVGGLAWALLLPMSMLGGGMIPLFAMPAWMQGVSNYSPVKWGILALEGAIWRGFSPADMLLPCGILVMVGIVGFTVGARVFRSAV